MTKSTWTVQQQSFSQIEYEAKKKRTRRDIFLAKMEGVVPWSWLMAVIEPHYPKSGRRGRPLKASLRAKVEHPFHIVKKIFIHKKTRYKGLRRTMLSSRCCLR